MAINHIYEVEIPELKRKEDILIIMGCGCKCGIADGGGAGSY